MKQLLTTAFLLMFGLFSFGQNLTINISGHVENADGTPVEDVNIYISTDSSLIWTGYYNTVQTDENGNYTDSFEAPSTVTQGGVWISLDDCNNNFQTETLYWNPGNTSLSADFIYCDPANDCSVSIVLDSIQNPNGQGLYAAVAYTDAITYSWNTGELTQDIFVTQSGTYCVTIVDSAGCSDSDCITIDLTPNNCWVDIAANPSSGLSANGQGIPPFAYQWNTGETTASILPNAAGSYCVTLTDAEGCSSSDCYWYGNPQDTSCYVYLLLDSITSAGLAIQAIGSGTAPFSYQWTTGANTSEILISESGLYCVTLTDANGCVAIACEEANLDPCQAQVYAGQNGSLFVSSSGTAPFTYLWNTGETNDFISPSEPGLYCVTVTDTEGCTSSDCLYFGNPQDSSCYVYILQIQNSATLEAVASGTVPFTYSWNTGELTSTINATEPGSYCVTLTDANGCESVDCFEIAPADNALIEGFVFLQDSSFFTQIFGTVYLYEFDEDDNLVLIDSVAYQSTPNGTGWYSFGERPAGEYIVLATLSPDSPGFDTNLPTYYGNVLWWNEATIITIPYAGSQYFTIIFIEGNMPPGPGFIGGSVGEMGFTDGNPTDRDDNPLANASIFLLDENDQPLAHTKPNAEGSFEFANLAWGTYKIYLEIPGHEQQHVVVTIGPDNPQVRDIVFEVEDGTVTSITEVQLEEQLMVYPIPAKDQLNVWLKNTVNGEVNLAISDARGKRRATYQVNVTAKSQIEVLNISNLPSGIYFLSLNRNGKLSTIRFVKI